ncbi:hypothetical protein Tco_1327184 [Tanacetum coccineum]
MLCFESAMEKQRYTQRVLDNTTVEKTPVMLTQLPIERHACEVYTHSIFRDVQDEIYKGLYACSQIDFCTDGDVDHCRIRQRDKRSNIVVEATEANKRAPEEVNESDEDEEVNESEEDNDVDEYDDVDEDDELDEDDANDDYDEDEDDA